jgi:hypothetical protein
MAIFRDHERRYAMQTRLFVQLPGLALTVLLTLLVGSATPQGTPNVIKGSPIVLDLSPSGGGQLLIGNNTNDNKIFLEGLSSDGNGEASEMLITGRFPRSLPLFSVLADSTRLLGTVQVGEDINAAFTFKPADASPNAGYIRFGDNTGWKLHFGRSRENSILTGAPLNTGITGVLMTLQDNGNAGIGTKDPTQKLDVAGTIRSSSGGFMFPDGTTQTTATLRGPQGPQGPQGP